MNTDFKSNRILSLDFFRGIAILGVVIVHLVIIGIFYAVDNGLNVLPVTVLAFFAPLIVFAPMAGLFVFISALANGITVQKRIAKGGSFKNSIQPLLITGIVLLIVHFIYIAFFKEQMPTIFNPDFAPGGLFPVLLIKRSWPGFTLDHFLMIDAFAMIMESVFFVLLLSFFVFHPKNKRSVESRLRFLLIFAIVWTFLSPFLWACSLKAMEFFYYQKNIWLRLPAIFLSFFAGKMHPITTIAPFAIFGLWFSVFLFQSPDYLTLRRETYKVSGILAGMALISLLFKAFLCFAKESAVYRFFHAVGIVEAFSMNAPAKLPHIDPRSSIEAGDFMNSVLNFIVVPPEWVFIAMIICFLFYPKFIKAFDYQTDERKAYLAKKIQPIRRFGTLSLTIFFFECMVQTLFSQFYRSFLIPHLKNTEFFGFLFRSPFYVTPKEQIALFDDFMVMWPVWILYLATAIGFWFLILYLWEKAAYKGSFEWLIYRMTGSFRKIKSDKMAAATDTAIYSRDKQTGKGAE